MLVDCPGPVAAVALFHFLGMGNRLMHLDRWTGAAGDDSKHETQDSHHSECVWKDNRSLSRTLSWAATDEQDFPVVTMYEGFTNGSGSCERKIRNDSRRPELHFLF